MNNPVSPNIAGVWLVLTGAFTFVTFVFWMIVSWRAMRAHERIASTLEERLSR